MENIYDVAIVGFGPAGAVAAGLLGQQGLSVFVCDKAREVYAMPRAFALDHEVLRVFQQLGIAEEVLTFAEPFTPSEFYGVDGQLIKRFITPEPPHPLGFVPSMVFTQPEVERVLRARVRSLPSVTIALGCELVNVSQDTQGASLDCRHDDGHNSTTRARYVLGCDGASSMVRGSLGIDLQDLGFDQPWLVVDVLVNAQGLAKLPTTSVQYCEPQRPCTFLIGPKNHRRWEISINDGEDPRQVASPEGTWQLLSRWLTPQDGTLWRQASYRFHALVAERWRVGRVFLAGDAAHQQPPFLGQGMCQGIRDVANLSWKLGAVLQDGAPDTLLDTYETERKTHVIELTTRIKGIGQLVGERDLAKARARDAHLLAECGGVVTSVPRQNVQPALQNGLFSHTPHAANGSIFPQPWIVQGNTRIRMDARCKPGWRLLLDEGAASGELRAAAEKAAAARPSLQVIRVAQSTVDHAAQSDALREAESVVGDWFNLHQCEAALVRPDNYVYGVARTALDIASLTQGMP